MGRHKTPLEKLKGFDLASFQTILFQSDDWPTAIMACQFMDTFLELAIFLTFENVPSDAEEAEVFSGYGPLSSFSSKITIAYYYNIINKDMRDDLRVLKFIRNEAAHRIKAFRFSDTDIESACKRLKLAGPLPSEFLDNSPIGKEAWDKIGFTSARAKFSLSCGRTFMHIGLMIKNHQAKISLLKAAATIAEAVQQPGALEKIIEILDKVGIPHQLRSP